MLLSSYSNLEVLLTETDEFPNKTEDFSLFGVIYLLTLLLEILLDLFEFSIKVLTKRF